MLMLVAAAQIDRLVVTIFNMQPDAGLIELAAGIQIDYVEHDMAAPDDVERRIEDVRWHRHVASLVRRSSRLLSSFGDAPCCSGRELFVDIVALPAGFLVVDLHVER